jgi:3-oxoacyl-[acyl-carrier-protein] synthase-3
MRARRHVLGPGESLTQLAASASQQALDMAGVAAEDIDLILFATSSPDDLFGAAGQVRSRARTRAFDMRTHLQALSSSTLRQQ